MLTFEVVVIVNGNIENASSNNNKVTVDVGSDNDDGNDKETTTWSVLNLVDFLISNLVLYSGNGVLLGWQYLSLGNSIRDRE